MHDITGYYLDIPLITTVIKTSPTCQCGNLCSTATSVRNTVPKSLPVLCIYTSALMRPAREQWLLPPTCATSQAKMPVLNRDYCVIQPAATSLLSRSRVAVLDKFSYTCQECYGKSTTNESTGKSRNLKGAL